MARLQQAIFQRGQSLKLTLIGGLMNTRLVGYSFPVALRQCISVLLGLMLASCSSAGNYLEDREKELGTNSTLDRSFHIIADEPQGTGLRMEGYVIGVEKTDREKLGVPGLTEDPYLNHKPAGSNKENNRSIAARLDDGKRTFISHVVEAHLDRERSIPYIRNQFLYDAYCRACTDKRRPSIPVWEIESDNLYRSSWEVLSKLEGAIRGQLKSAQDDEQPFTHIVVGTMGWNTPQEKAIRNLNSIFGNILISSENGFKPLYIAITWPSEWNTPGVSLRNKANDADEIGLVWANALLNRHLVNLREGAAKGAWPEFDIVAIGHSLGARMMTRAAFSGAVLNPPVVLEDGIDLVIGLQGAFSMNRFLAERKQGREGAPYSEYKRLRGTVALTWSEHDSATPIGNLVSGANYAGAKLGHERAVEYEEHFAFYTATEEGDLVPESASVKKEKQVIYIDASELVKYEVLGAGGKAHSDIYNAYMGNLLSTLILRAEQSNGDQLRHRSLAL